MIWTLVSILVMVSMIVALRLAVWRGLCLVYRLFRKSATFLKQVQVRKDISGLGSKIRKLFPEATRLLQARLTPRRYTGLPLTLIVISALYIAALLGGLVGELLEADELVRLGGIPGTQHLFLLGNFGDTTLISLEKCSVMT